MRKKFRLHPGRFLKESLPEYGITQYALAKGLSIPHSRLTAIIKGERGISADTAVRLGAYFGNTPEFWLNLQNGYDLDAIDADQVRAQVTPHPSQPPADIPLEDGKPPKGSAATRTPRAHGGKAAKRAA